MLDRLTPLALRMGERLRPDIWWRLPQECRDADQPIALLTLDDGPGERYLPAVLEVLREQDAPATFFLLGDRCERFPHMVRAMAQAGHGLALHGPEHLPLEHPRALAIPDLLKRNLAQIEATLGATAHVLPLFRPPFGRISRRACREVADHGFQAVNCSILPGNAGLPPFGPRWREDSAEVADRVARALHPGAIIALHCGERLAGGGTVTNHGIYDMPQAAEAVRRVIHAIRARSYTLASFPPHALAPLESTHAE